MTKRAGKKTTAAKAKAKTANNKRSSPASRKSPTRKTVSKKKPAAGRPRGSRGKNTTGDDQQVDALPLAPGNSREGQIQRGLIELGLLGDPKHLRRDAIIVSKAINERWPSAAPSINMGLRQVVESLAFQNAGKGKTREVARLLNILLRMEAQNQRDQADQIQRQDEETRLQQMRDLMTQMQAIVANASQDPAFFDALHRPENAGRDASPREPGGAGAGNFQGGLEIISASGDRK